jgi:hypothetical protein
MPIEDKGNQPLIKHNDIAPLVVLDKSLVRLVRICQHSLMVAIAEVGKEIRFRCFCITERRNALRKDPIQVIHYRIPDLASKESNNTVMVPVCSDVGAAHPSLQNK